MKRTTGGFTIIEILVVVAVIGILATISLVGFNRYQTSARDSQRSSRATILAEALEKYYDKNGEYPSCPSLTGSAETVSTSVLPGLDSKTLVTPRATSGTTNSIKCEDLSNMTQPDLFAYVGDGSDTCTNGSSCLQFTLKYKEESSGLIIPITSRRNTAIATSGTSTITTNPISFTQINTSWTAVPNATSYQLERATDSSFTPINSISQIVSGTSASATSLLPNTLYYFRIRANSASGQGPWSNIATGQTWGLSTPTVSAVANSSTQITSSWAIIAHATTYAVQCSTDNVTWGSGCQNTTAGLNYAWTPIGQGV
jgi:type IV pilus assembly protein PilE